MAFRSHDGPSIIRMCTPTDKKLHQKTRPLRADPRRGTLHQDRHNAISGTSQDSTPATPSPEEALDEVLEEKLKVAGCAVPVELVGAVKKVPEDIDGTSTTIAEQATETGRATTVVDIVGDEVEVTVDSAASRPSGDVGSREALESDELEEAATSPDSMCVSSGSTHTP